MGRAQDQLAAPLRTIVGLHVLVALVGLAFALLAALAETTGVTPSCATSAAA
jgi:hypothetical protein